MVNASATNQGLVAHLDDYSLFDDPNAWEVERVRALLDGVDAHNYLRLSGRRTPAHHGDTILGGEVRQEYY